MKFTNAIEMISFVLLCTMVKADLTFGRPATMSSVSGSNAGSWIVDNKLNTPTAITLIEALPWINI